MPKLSKGILAAVLAAVPSVLSAQSTPVSDTLAVDAAKAWTWQEKETHVAQFDGPVKIQLDNVQMSADSAVVWITPTVTGLSEMQQVEIALIGNARLQHDTAKRTSDRLFVTAIVRGAVSVSANDRLARDRSEAGVYQAASGMRDESGLNIRSEEGRWRLPRPSAIAERPATRPAGLPTVPVQTEIKLVAGAFERHRMPDGTLAFAVNKGLQVTIRRGAEQTGMEQTTQLIADRGVLFTTLKQLAGDDKLAEMTQAQQAIDSVYLEGDVRVLFSPNDAKRPDVQLEANQVYYEITTDRAVLTDAVMHSMDPSSRVPVVIRASTIKQLSREADQRQAEYRAEKAVLTTSSFATPTYAVAADRAYIKQYDSGDDYFGTRTDFSGRNTSLDFWGTPVLWLPYAGGSITDKNIPLRALDIGSSSRYGFFTRTEWGFFETIGRHPPRDLDISYRVDYLANRGPAGGIDADYRGDFATEDAKSPWGFEGDLRTYFIYDRGDDVFGGNRNDVPLGNSQFERPEDFRGRIFWEHQQFLPEDWQIQLRYAWLSDPGFLEEYYPEKYHGIEPEDAQIYVKHQRDTEAFTILGEMQTNHFVSTQEYAQEFLEVKRMPELGYYRIGDSFGDNAFTFYSANTVSRLGYDTMSQKQIDQLGYPFQSGKNYPEGFPVEGSTGTTDNYVDRGDFRQEVGYPLAIEKFRVVPYVMGRYTTYSDSPSAGGVNRGLGGGGVRMTTAFWKVDDYAQSDLWDIHRIRNVIEPEINAFGSVGGTKPNDVFIFDEPVDDVSNISGVQVALHDRWQTKRGAPGKWESVDYFTWNIEGNFFFNKPPDPTYIDGNYPAGAAILPYSPNNRYIPPLGGSDPNPQDFRGLYFPSAPETSIARDSVNSDQLWRISDSTAVLADQQTNIDAGTFATGSIGVAARRGDRMTYYIGQRYIDPLDSNITSFLFNYEVSTRYSLGFGQSYDFGSSENVSSNVSVLRRFDRFYVALALTFNDNTGESGLFINVRPTGAPSAISAQNIPGIFGN